MTVITAIDGFRVVAERSQQYAGQEGPYWYDKDTKEWTDVWCDQKKKPDAAKVVVLKMMPNGAIAKTPAVAHWSEYGQARNKWVDMPALMLAKCAEALALRKAFPNDLSGLYTKEEMDQAGVDGNQDDKPKSPTANAVDDINAELERRESGADSEPVPVQEAEGEIIDADYTVTEDPPPDSAEAVDQHNEDPQNPTELEIEEHKIKEDAKAKQTRALVEANTQKMKAAVDAGKLDVNAEVSKKALR